MWKFVPKKEKIGTKNWNMVYKLHIFWCIFLTL